MTQQPRTAGRRAFCGKSVAGGGGEVDWDGSFSEKVGKKGRSER